jgi:phosphatidylserine/phosphatidylglycerophosphate/cardiolipin synthase-like enzyme
LTDGGQHPLEVARELVEFLEVARTSLDIAQYDFNLGPETRKVVGNAIRDAAARGVEVRIAYNVDHRLPIPVPPPPEPDVALISSLDVPSKPIAGAPDLMHHKFVVRDGESVWTGSLNWTDDSWSRQENVVVVIRSGRIADAFRKDFEQMWDSGTVEETGRVDPSAVDVDGNAAWKIPILKRVLQAPFSGKPSSPYEARSVHDFMHAKVTVADDTVFTGSFNLSRRGEKNAENMLEIHDSALADRLAGFVDEVRIRYPRFTR